MQPFRASSHVAPKLPPVLAGGMVGQAPINGWGMLNTGDDESHDEVVRLAANVCGTPAAMLSFIHRGQQWLVARIGIDAVECPRALFLSAQAIRGQDQVMVVPDVDEDPRFARTWTKTSGMPFRFYAGAPLVAPRGTPFGMISVIDRISRGLTASQATALTSLARQIVRQLALGQENNALRQANARLAEISMTDALTGIANRRAFNERLAAEQMLARRSGDTFSLLLMDVDYFKLFNDRYGHQAGDEALVKVANALKGSKRISDVLARYGGEEFALILPQTRMEAAAAVAERLRVAIEGVPMPGQHLTLSIGVAGYSSAIGTDGLIAAADEALYAAKAGGRNQVAVAQRKAT